MTWRVAVLLLLFLVPACGNSVPSPTGTAMLTTCGEPAQVPGVTGDAPVQTHRFCMGIPVLDSGGAARTIQVLVVSDAESHPLADRTVLVYHPGGPGISAVEALANDPPPVDLHEYAILAWDGTTASADLGACGPASMEFGSNRAPATLAEAADRVAAECMRGFAGPADIGAAAAARELEVIRTKLDIESFDLLSVSYGTAIAESYLRAYPGRVRHAVLDAPIAMEAPWESRITAVGTALLDGANSLAATCTSAACDALRSGSDQLSYEALRRGVLAAAPEVGGGNVLLTGTMLDQATELALHDASSWPAFVAAVELALHGDGSQVWALGEKEYFDIDRSVFYRSLCADIKHPDQSAAFALPPGDLLRTYTGELAPCAGFPYVGLPEQAAGEPAGDVLIVASQLDVLAPSSLLDSAPDLRNMGGTCLTNAPGHTNLRDAATQRIILQFLRDGDVAAAVNACGSG